MDCLICERLNKWRKSSNPTVIHEFKHSLFVVGDYQLENYRGYSLILYKEHVRELHELDNNLQKEIFSEVMKAGKAVFDAYKPWKMNYTCLGNQDPHIHWHIIPRYQTDPHHKSLPWTGVDFTKEKKVDEKICSEVIYKLKGFL